MQIAITAVSPSIEAAVDPRFGRGAFLLVVDSETLAYQAHPNPGVSASGGAGIKTAQFVVAQKVAATISGDYGPNAFDALNAANVPMYIFGTTRTVREAIERFNAGQLERVGTPTHEGHHH